jgi:hypothetical protein
MVVYITYPKAINASPVLSPLAQSYGGENHNGVNSDERETIESYRFSDSGKAEEFAQRVKDWLLGLDLAEAVGKPFAVTSGQRIVGKVGGRM